MKIEIRESTFSPWQEVQAYQDEKLRKSGKFGATAIFIGTMRDVNEGDEVAAMQLDYYPGMTQKHLQQIAQSALEEFEIFDVLVLHRVGRVFPGEPIVCIAVWSAHRDAAYRANRFIMEDLKSKAPFWKKESLREKERWVERNT